MQSVFLPDLLYEEYTSTWFTPAELCIWNLSNYINWTFSFYGLKNMFEMDLIISDTNQVLEFPWILKDRKIFSPKLLDYRYT